MTKEQKQLLLVDLCARLPYGVIVKHPYGFGKLESITKEDYGYDLTFETPDDNYYTLDNNIKPYLRPMSTMTSSEEDVKNNLTDEAEVVDFLNEHHFDYRNLIDKGLALVAPEDMYTTT